MTLPEMIIEIRNVGYIIERFRVVSLIVQVYLKRVLMDPCARNIQLKKVWGNAP